MKGCVNLCGVARTSGRCHQGSLSFVAYQANKLALNPHMSGLVTGLGFHTTPGKEKKRKIMPVNSPNRDEPVINRNVDTSVPAGGYFLLVGTTTTDIAI